MTPAEEVAVRAQEFKAMYRAMNLALAPILDPPLPLLDVYRRLYDYGPRFSSTSSATTGARTPPPP